MDPFIRDFEVKEIETEVLESTREINEVLSINSNLENFKVCHLNIRSIQKNFEELEILLEELSHKFEIIALTETWKIENIELYKLNGYNIIYNEGIYNQNDGVVVLIKDNLNFDVEINNIGPIKAIRIKVNFFENTLDILCLYKSPALNDNDFLDHLEHYLESKTFNSHINLILGDININLLVNDNITNEYLNILSEHDFISTINKATRVYDGKGSCLDHIFIKTLPNVLENSIPIILKSNITDHYTTMVQIITNTKVKDQVVNENFIKIIKFKTLKNELKNTFWNEVYEVPDVESATKTFINIILNKIDNHTKLIKNKHKKRKRNPWITCALIKSVEHKNKLHLRMQRYPGNINLQEEYKNYRNILTKLIKKRKREYYKNKIESEKNNSKTLWCTVNEIRKKSNMKTDIKRIYNHSNEITENKKEICNIFNKTYVSMGENMAKLIDRNPQYKENNKRNDRSMFLFPTSVNEVRNTIMELKNKKSPGIDGIRAETLKQIVDYITEPITHIINLCFKNGECPSVFKVSVVKPIYKKGDKLEPTNYRPISLITNFTKIFEKILKTRINSFVNKFKLISTNQYGFREKKSTSDAIACLTQKIYLSVDQSKPSLGIFLDLAKAFDTVSHSMLIETLEIMGIRNLPLQLIQNYLTDRKQCVSIGNEKSVFRSITYGVPQGTILGPLLFILYINNLFQIDTCAQIISYADDTVVYYEDKTWNDLKTKVESDFVGIKKWLDYKLLSINFDKTFFISFTSYSPHLPNFNILNISVNMKKFDILQTDSIKYLGIYIDQHLRWDDHVNKLLQKLRGIIPLFRSLQGICSNEQLLIIYKALVESHLRYGILGWGGVLDKNLCKLEIIQKRILKIIFQKNVTYPSENLFSLSKVMDIRQIFFFALVMVQYSIQKNYISVNRCHLYETRNLQSIKIPRMQKTVGQRCSYYLSPKMFNSLPLFIKKAENKNIFKQHCYKYVLQNNRNMFHTLLSK